MPCTVTQRLYVSWMRGVLDVLALRVAHQMPVDRIAGQRHVLAHAVQLDALDEHLARRHGHDVAAEEGLCRILRCLDLDVARQQAHFAALIHVEGDLAEVHVVELLVERDVVASDGGNRAALGLAGIEVRRGEDDLVADFPALGIQHLDRGGAGVGRRGQLGPGVGVRSPCRFSVPPEIMMPRSPMPAMMSSPFTLSVKVMVALRVWGLASVPICQLAVQHDPLGGELQVGVVREGELAVDRHAAQSRRADVQDHFLVTGDARPCRLRLAPCCSARWPDRTSSSP